MPLARKFAGLMGPPHDLFKIVRKSVFTQGVFADGSPQALAGSRRSLSEPCFELGEHLFDRVPTPRGMSVCRALDPTCQTAAVIEKPECRERAKSRAPLDPQGYDAARKIKSRKRHLLVDTEGLLLFTSPRAAGIQDRDGGISLMTSSRKA